MHNTQGFKRLYIIRDGSEGIKSLTSMIGKTVIKLIWMFPKLDFFSKLNLVSPYLLTDFHMKNGFSSENVLIRKIFLEIILSVFFKYIFYVLFCKSWLVRRSYPPPTPLHPTYF